MILVLMGVCGCGKTTVGIHLAEKDRYPWLLSIHNYMTRISLQHQSGVITCSALKRSYRDILRFGSGSTALTHPQAFTEVSLQISPHGLPIKDTGTSEENGGTSLETDIGDKYSNCNQNERNSVMKQDIENAKKSGLEILFVHLTGSKEIIQRRMETRQGHFMPVTLLQSQLQTLEPLGDTEPGIEVDVGKNVEEIAQEIVEKL